VKEGHTHAAPHMQERFGAQGTPLAIKEMTKSKVIPRFLAVLTCKITDTGSNKPPLRRKTPRTITVRPVPTQHAGRTVCVAHRSLRTPVCYVVPWPTVTPCHIAFNTSAAPV